VSIFLLHDTSKPIAIGKQLDIGRIPISTTVTPGIRYNFNSGTNRGAINFKFELPKGYLDGWTPYLGVEIRK